jgi:hypothetical protein
VQERPEAKRLPPAELVGERLVEDPPELPGVPAEQLAEAILNVDQHREHLERVAVHVEVVVARLLHVVQVAHLGQHGAEQAEPVGQPEAFERAVRDHESAQLGEDTLAGGARHAPRRGRRQALRLGLGLKAELGGEAGEPQRTQRVALVGLGTQHPQDARLDVGTSAQRVDQVARLEAVTLDDARLARHGVHGEVPLAEVLLDRLSLQRREVPHPPAAPVDHPPRAEGLREPKHRAADPVGDRAGHPRRVARHRHVHVAHGPPEQLVAQGTADDPGVAHRTCSRRTRGRRPVVTS